jgi:hypothetical protein
MWSMKNDLFLKVILSSILLCLAVIAFRSNNTNDNIIQTPTPNVEVHNENGRVVQIAPNRVGVVDLGNASGWQQLIVFEYNSETKKFEVVSTLPYEDIFNHPKENGIPVRDDKYGN